MNIPRSNFPRVVIIGGGFAGISLAKKLANRDVQVVLLDRHNYHTFNRCYIRCPLEDWNQIL